MAKRSGQKSGPGDPPPEPTPRPAAPQPAFPSPTAVPAPIRAEPGPRPAAPAAVPPAPQPAHAAVMHSTSTHAVPAHAVPAHAAAAAHEGHGGGEPHIVPTRTYYIVFAWLMVLLIITLGAAIPNLGPLNLPIALTIAFIKSGLIFLFFMHLKWSSKLVRLFAWGAFFWLAIMFVLTLSDYLAPDSGGRFGGGGRAAVGMGSGARPAAEPAAPGAAHPAGEGSHAPAPASGH